jgi:hypothetical protein
VKKREPFKRLHALGAARIAEIDQMIGRGDLPRDIAQIIRAEWGLLTDVRADSVKKMLERYRKTELRAKVIAQVSGANELVRTKTMQKRLNAMEEIQNLVAVQRGRFEKMLVREQAGPLLLKQVSEEGRLLKDMLVELGKLQLETGLLVRAPKKLTGTLTDEEGNIQRFSWTEEQEALARIIEGQAERVEP